MDAKFQLRGYVFALFIGLLAGGCAGYLYERTAMMNYIEMAYGFSPNLVYDWDHTEAVDINLSASRIGLLVVRGTLRSKASLALTELSVSVDVYDPEGEIVTSCIDRLTQPLEAGESQPFVVECRSLSFAAYQRLGLTYEISYLGVLSRPPPP